MKTQIPEEIKRLIEDPKFKGYLQEEITNLKKIRTERPPAPAGYHYARDWYDRMTEQFMLNADFFSKNICDIWMKQSNLNREFRSVILETCNAAVYKTQLYYATIRQAAEQQKEKPRAKRKPKKLME